MWREVVAGDKGYFKAEVETVASQALNESPDSRTIAVTLRIREGEQYRVAASASQRTTFSIRSPASARNFLSKMAM